MDSKRDDDQSGPLSCLSARIKRVPRAFDPERGAETAARFTAHPPEVRALLAGTAGSSPYLKGLIERDPTWLDDALSVSPEAQLETELCALAALDGPELAAGLRLAKRRIALLVALADLAGVWDLAEVTGALTALADIAVHRGIQFLVGREIARGKLPGLTPEDAESGGGMVAIAMGKMGAHELNYSSDIDLICLFDESRFERSEYQDARAAFVRATRGLTTLLSDNTQDGYVFRTDLRLRPDPAVTPVCLAMEAAERYYESLGRTWERAAYIKARPAGGDIEAGSAFLARLEPFVFRRHLDFAAIRDAHDMRLRIREHKSLGGSLKLEGHDLKLGSGGIREIEFYTQTRQIIAGGRDASLRIRGTVEALRALEDKGWTEDADTLIETYRHHRTVEHRLQMTHDQRTHRLPASPEGFARLAALMDMEINDLQRDIRSGLELVSRVTEGFFRPGEARETPKVADAQREIVQRWRSYPALRSARANEIFGRLEPEILQRLNERAARPEEALVHLDGFLGGLPAGVQLFSMFEANPQLIDLIVDIAATSPALARYLSRHSSVLDAVIGGGFFAEWRGVTALTQDLDVTLVQAPDYEARLLAARHWRNEWHFRTGVHHLRGLSDGAQAGQHYAHVAEAVVAALYPVVVAEFAQKHGDPPGRGAMVLGMGSVGAEALTASSDLDLIMIYDPAGVEVSDGRRPLPARTYYARLTQAFVTALTAPMGPGRLYDVDMRLRPSGRQGPVATSLAAFVAYQREEAWTWEHLALTRARPLAGSPDLQGEVEDFRRTLIGEARDAAKVLADVADMRSRLADARQAESPWNPRDGAGRLQDIALLAQAGALLSGSATREVRDQILGSDGVLGLTASEADMLAD
ncbi:MAG: glutamine-synthetase adenylyltransferase, partial [Pseudomonadota bacterium]